MNYTVELSKSTPSFERGENDHIILHWGCLNCGWEIDMEAPGYPGNGYSHHDDGRTPCGPMIAWRK